MNSFINEISERYIDSQKGVFNKYYALREYDGTSMDKTVYILEKESELICTEYQLLIGAVSNPDAEINPLEMNAQAYVISGLINGLIGDTMYLKHLNNEYQMDVE